MGSCLRWDEKTWQQAISHRVPDLIMFAYGTNEAVNTSMSLTAYERDLREVVRRARKGAPQAACMFISPFDFPQLHEGAPVPRPIIERIVEVQRRVAQQAGCGFWDGYAFMGGRGSMARWASTVPPLASNDLVHLTPLGYTLAGTGIGDALLRRYDANEHYWRGNLAR